MIKKKTADAGLILDRFIEGIFRHLLDHHRAHMVEMDLTAVQVQTLTSLYEEPFAATRLAALLSISGPAMTQLTDRLIRKQLIERRPVDADRRAVMIALTEEGNRMVNRFRERRREMFAQILSRLNEADRAEVIETLNKVVMALEEHREHILERKERKVAASLGSVQDRESKPRTAVNPAQASNEVGQPTVSVPVRRMRIEWD